MKIIDLSLARQMVDSYSSTRKKLIDSTYGINDTQSIWFDIAGIKDFVNKLPDETTGVRIYLSAYDDTEPIAPGQTTVILIGTVAGNNGDDDAILNSEVFAAGLKPLNQGKQCPPICT